MKLKTVNWRAANEFRKAVIGRVFLFDTRKSTRGVWTEKEVEEAQTRDSRMPEEFER